jgi:ferredoxin
MEVQVDPEICISCGTCVDLCPDIFDWDDDGKAKAVIDEVPEEKEDCARETVDSCPVEAIKETN